MSSNLRRFQCPKCNLIFISELRYVNCFICNNTELIRLDEEENNKSELICSFIKKQNDERIKLKRELKRKEEKRHQEMKKFLQKNCTPKGNANGQRG